MQSAASYSKGLAQDAKRSKQLLQSSQKVTADVKATIVILNQLVKTANNVELALRRREIQLLNLDAGALNGEDTILKNINTSLDLCHKHLRALRIFLEPWERNSTSLAKLILSIRLVTSQKSTFVRLKEKIKLASDALRGNLNILSVFIGIDTQERLGITDNKVTQISQAVGEMSKILKRMDPQHSSKSRTQSPSHSQSIPHVNIDHSDTQDGPTHQQSLNHFLNRLESVSSSVRHNGNNLTTHDTITPAYHDFSSGREDSDDGYETDDSDFVDLPNQPEEYLTAMIEEYQDQAQSHCREGQYSNAQADFESAIQYSVKRQKQHGIGFDKISLKNQLAEIHLKRKDFDAALKIWLHYIPDDISKPENFTPDECQYLHLVGDTFYLMWRHRDTEETLHNADKYTQLALYGKTQSKNRDDASVSQTAELHAVICDSLADKARANVARKYIVGQEQRRPRENSGTNSISAFSIDAEVRRSPSYNEISTPISANSSASRVPPIPLGHDPTIVLASAIRSHDVPRALDILNLASTSISVDTRIKLDFERLLKPENLPLLLLAFSAAKLIPVVTSILELSPHILRDCIDPTHGRTAAHRSAAQGGAEMLKFALKNEDSLVSKPDCKGLVPLLVAVKENSPQAKACIDVILELFGNDNYTENYCDVKSATEPLDGWTAVHIAVNNICKASSNPISSRSFHKRSSSSTSSINKIHSSSSTSSTPKPSASAQRALDLLTYLIDSHFPLDTRASNGETPLLTACFNANAAAAELLLKAGANGSAVTNSGSGALALAVADRNPMHDVEGVVRVLLAAGVKPQPNMPPRWDRKCRHLWKAV